MLKQLAIATSLFAASGLMQLAPTEEAVITPADKKVIAKPVADAKEIADTSFSLPSFPKRIPTLLVKRSEKDATSSPLHIKKIKLDVKVVGNISTTTMDITFYNDLNRVLDGEFCFPLGEGQSVSYFAMETANGLQEASVVEKAKGRIVYESIVRRKIDPALLEWTAGNNFRSRIYPIPAKGYKRVIIGFEQELLLANNTYLYYQPFFFKDKVDVFSIHTEVFRQEVKPELYGDDRVTLEFDKWKENWVAETKINDYIADKPLAFSIPLNENTKRVFVEKADKGNSAFYLTVEPKLFSSDKKLPSKIGLLWDMSGSAEKSDLVSIMRCLNEYMKKASYPSVDFVTFSNEITETVSFPGGQKGWESLVEKIKTIIPDGGTQLGCLDLSKYNSDEFILVSDGMSNFGASQVKVSSKPVNTICSSPSADYSYLKYLAVTTGGSYINLNTVNQKEAITLLCSQHYHFISAEYDKNILSNVFPSQPVDITRSFSMAGILEGYSSDITLNFGIGDKILYKEKLTITNKPEEYNNMVPKMWAQKKLAEMDVFYESNKDEITDLAKQYGVVTRNTSLLILDGIADYLTYKVVPKDVEMKKQYFAQVNESKRNIEAERKTHIEGVVQQFTNWIKWYDTDYASVKQAEIKAKAHADSTRSFTDLREVEVVEYQAPLIDPDTRSGSTITRDQFTNMAQREVNTIVSQTAGVFQADEGAGLNIRGSRGDATAYYVDGVRVTGSPGVPQSADAPQSKSLKAAIKLGAWSPDAAYMYELKKTSKENLYAKYLELKPAYMSTPSFFVDVSDYFIKQGEEQLALRILSNIAELQLENPQLLRVLAHRLQQLDQNRVAIKVFEDVLKMREEEPQSYRDLGLAYAQNKEYQKAVDVLCKVVNRKWDNRFPEVEVLVACEINHIIGTSGKDLQVDSLDKRLIKPMPCDIRVVINWDTDNCDMDLWVTDPSKEKCLYNHALTSAGGKISRDFTGGYGPEVFMIKKADEGKYKVEVNYYGSNNQSLSGPTTVQAELYTNYGLPNESKKVVTLRLENNKEVVNLADLLFAKK